MRCFIAIDIDEGIKRSVSELQNELKGCNADLRWVKPENIHLTLKFLGDVEEKRIDKIKGKLIDACARYNAFTIEIKGMGLFPDKKRPRVLWVDVRDNNSLLGIQRDIEDAMASIGFEKEDRGFSPHLTIARFRSLKGIEALYDKIQLHKDDSLGLMDVKTVSLMESKLKPSGPEYRRVAEVCLKV
ncbi:MAG: RNA 2',3'-cyclic phosphodiesterase [Thermodesulfovibrionia bacterium]